MRAGGGQQRGRYASGCAGGHRACVPAVWHARRTGRGAKFLALFFEPFDPELTAPDRDRNLKLQKSAFEREERIEAQCVPAV